MSQRITKVRKKTASGFGDPIPIGAEASNITMSDGTVLQDVIDQLQNGSAAGHEVLTQAEYNALSTAVQNNGTIYFISDGDVTNDDSDHVQLTSFQYSALSTAIQNNGTIYFVSDDVINTNDIDHIELTQAEYNALSTATQNNGNVYFISDTNNNSNNNSNHVELTLSQYNALSTAVQNNGTVYFVDDGSGGGTTHAANIQYNHNASQLNANDVQSAIDEIKNSYIDFLAPKVFTPQVSSIQYKGTGTTGITYNMIKFIDNTTDDNGYSIAIGGGGTTIIGGGESAATILASTMFNTASGGENMVVANDNGITFLSNVDSGASYAKKMIFDTNGHLLVRSGGNVYIGYDKTSAYGEDGLWLGSNGNIIITKTGAENEAGGGIFFAREGGTNYQSYIQQDMSNYIKISPHLLCTGEISAQNAGNAWNYAKNTITNAYIALLSESSGTHGLRSNGYYNGSALVQNQRYLIYRGADGNAYVPAHYSNAYGLIPISNTVNTKKVGCLTCNSATQFIVHGQWGSSSFADKTITVSSSDPRLKENIQPTTIDALDLINKINLYSFDWKEDKKHWDVGFLAPELYELEPNLAIKPQEEKDKIAYWCVDDFYLTGLQTKAIQELSKQNNQLKSQIKDLKQEINELKQNLIRLENLII